MRVTHKEWTMPEKVVMACSRFRKLLLQAPVFKEVSVCWSFGYREEDWHKKVITCLSMQLSPFLWKKCFQPESGCKAQLAFGATAAQHLQGQREKERVRVILWFVTSLEKIVVFPPSLKSCNCRSWIYGGSRANRTNYFISQCNTAIKVSPTVVPRASLLHKNCTHMCMHMHTHAHTSTKWQSLLQNACVWGRARYILPRRKSARNNDDCH